jgi:hypothetical protein
MSSLTKNAEDLKAWIETYKKFTETSTGYVPSPDGDSIPSKGLLINQVITDAQNNAGASSYTKTEMDDTFATPSDVDAILDTKADINDLVEVNSTSAAVVSPTLSVSDNPALIGTNITLTASGSVSAFSETNSTITYHWNLPNIGTQTGSSVIYNIPNDPGLDNTTLSFECYAKDGLGNKSLTKVITVTIKASANTPPSFDNYILKVNGIQKNEIAKNDTNITIDILASDADNDILTYSLTPDASLASYITINQDLGVPERFNISIDYSFMSLPTPPSQISFNYDISDSQSNTTGSFSIPLVVNNSFIYTHTQSSEIVKLDMDSNKVYFIFTRNTGSDFSTDVAIYDKQTLNKITYKTFPSFTCYTADVVNEKVYLLGKNTGDSNYTLITTSSNDTNETIDEISISNSDYDTLAMNFTYCGYNNTLYVGFKSSSNTGVYLLGVDASNLINKTIDKKIDNEGVIAVNTNDGSFYHVSTNGTNALYITRYTNTGSPDVAKTLTLPTSNGTDNYKIKDVKVNPYSGDIIVALYYTASNSPLIIVNETLNIVKFSYAVDINDYFVPHKLNDNLGFSGSTEYYIADNSDKIYKFDISNNNVVQLSGVIPDNNVPLATDLNSYGNMIFVGKPDATEVSGYLIYSDKINSNGTYTASSKTLVVSSSNVSSIPFFNSPLSISISAYTAPTINNSSTALINADIYSPTPSVLTNTVPIFLI